MTEFEKEVVLRVQENGANAALHQAGLDFTRSTLPPHYSYNFFWLGRPIIQYPQDIVAMQELIWQIKPDLIIETGIAHGIGHHAHAGGVHAAKHGHEEGGGMDAWVPQSVAAGGAHV